jgi:hypothetical protein
MYKSKHLPIEMLVPPAIINSAGEESWKLLDDRIIKAADRLFEKFGEFQINNWKDGGDQKYNGFLPAYVNQSNSDHYLNPRRYGRGLRCKFQKVSCEVVGKFIEANPTKFKQISFTEYGDNSIELIIET